MVSAERNQNIKDISHVIISEGLCAASEDNLKPNPLSSYYAKVIETVSQLAETGEEVFFTPGNNFSHPCREDIYAVRYLETLRKDLKTNYIDENFVGKNLDTLDNALLLRDWLIHRRRWSLQHAHLYCYRFHTLRSWLLFRLCGFSVEKIISSNPKVKSKDIVPRLWFYNYPLVHILYEIAAIMYSLMRYFVARLKKRNILWT
jgi:hypothetical protein